MLFRKKIAILLMVAMVMAQVSSSFADPVGWEYTRPVQDYVIPADEYHVVETTAPAVEGGNPTGPVVEEYMTYVDDDKKIEPGSLSGDVNLSNVGKGLFYDGTDFYFFLDTGIMATNFMYNIQGDRFFFGEDGKMVKDEIVSYNGELYYFDVNGAMYKNRWYTEEEIDTYDNTVEYTTYYFGPTGRAYRAGDNPIVLKTIDEYKYGFNSDGERLEGYYNLDGTKLEPDEDPAYEECMYYFDPQEGGAAATGWHYYGGSVRGDEYDDNEEIVLFFDEKSCRKVYSKDADKCIARTIEGERYMFDANGVRKNKWYTMDPTRPSTRSNTRYFNQEYDGYLAKGWFLAIPPEHNVNIDNDKRHENNEEVWFYALSNGSIVKNSIRKIGSYYYAFDEDGVMQEDCMVKAIGTKFVKSYKTDHLFKANLLLDPKEYGLAQRSSSDDMFEDGKGLLDASAGEKWMYFVGESENEDKVGAMANLNSPVKIELNDTDVYLIASSVGGYTVVGDGGKTEVVKRNNKFLQNGILLKPSPDDNNYGLVKYRVTTHDAGIYLDWQNARRDAGAEQIYQYFVVNSSGGVVGKDPDTGRGQYETGRKCIKDKQGNYIYIDASGQFIGCYSVQGRVTKASTTISSPSDVVGADKVIVKGEEIWQYKEDKEWINGLPPMDKRVNCDYMYLNFAAKDVEGNPFDPYENGLASLVYNEEYDWVPVSSATP